MRILLLIIALLCSPTLLGQTVSGATFSGASLGTLPIITDDVLTDFETSTNGTQITAAILTAATHGGNGSWTIPYDCSGGTCPVSVISTSCQNDFLTRRNVGGTIYSGSGTRGLLFNEGTGILQYGLTRSFTTSSNSASYGIWFNTSVPTSNGGLFSNGYIGDGGNDFANGLFGNGGYVYPEVTLNPNGPDDYAVGPSCNYAPGPGGAKYGFFPYAINTWYFVTTQFNEYQDSSTMHLMQVYSATGQLLCTQGKYARNGGAGYHPNNYNIGRGSEGNAVGATSCNDNLVIDYTTGALQQP